MKSKPIIRLSRFLILSALLLLTSCSPLVISERPTSGAPSPVALPTQGVNPIYMAATQTVQAQTPTQNDVTAASMSPTAAQTEDPLPAAPSVPTNTECQDKAQYISDDGLDGTIYAPNTPFTKSWTVKNTGSCTWDNQYLVAYISGATMTQQPGYFILPPGQTIAPGQTLHVSIGMASPIEDGNYKSYWGLKKVDGQLMLIEDGANSNSFYVEIQVNRGISVANGKVTEASIGIQLEQGSGSVCTADSTYFVRASITADGPITASYEVGSTSGQIAAGNFQGSNGSLSPYVSGTIVFDQADTEWIHLCFVGPYPYLDDITVFLRVNGGEFHNARLSCQE